MSLFDGRDYKVSGVGNRWREGLMTVIMFEIC